MVDMTSKINFDAAVINELEIALTKLERGDKALIVPSGTSAIALTLMAFSQPGDHILISDCVYYQTREFCEKILKPNNVEVSYYAPSVREDIINLIKPNTKLIYCESPSSWTFEVQDIPTISRIAHQHDIMVIADNTWATPLLCNPLSLGADVVLHSLSKYIAGYNDVTLGAIITSNKYFDVVKRTAVLFGIEDWAKSELSYLALRGLQTLSLRLSFYQDNALQLIRELSRYPQIEKIYYPALPDNIGYQYWKRDFKGANGVFSLALRTNCLKKVNNFLMQFKTLKVESGWGGYKSLIQISDKKLVRTCENFPRILIRISVGAENYSHLILDFKRALKYLENAD